MRTSQSAQGVKRSFLQWHWEDRLIWASLFVILTQWAHTLIPYWYEETISMTFSMLNLMLVIGLLIPVHPWIRIPFGLIIVAYSVVDQLKAYDLWLPLAMEGKLGWLQVHPYIWLVGLIWITYELFMRFVRTSWHVTLLLVIQLLVFGILDSFTMDTLWDQVAWTMGASLLWLIGVHFRRMKARFPERWEIRPKYVLQIALSAILLLSLVITVGVSMPGLRPILMDPYTAFVMKGERTGPLGELSGLGAANSGTSDQRLAESGYSSDDTKLGDGFRLNYSPVMLVQTEQVGYWRAESKSIYQGDGWLDYEGYDNSPYAIVEQNESLRDAFSRDSKVKTTLVKQTITMQHRGSYPALFGIGTIQKVEAVQSESNDPLYWHRYDSELASFGNRDAYPSSYTIVSEVPVYTPDQLRSSSRNKTYTRTLWEPYLQLPQDYSPKVAELAQQIVEGADNDYDRAKRIEEYLRTNYRYTTQPNTKRRASEDFVESFLFEVREGYCDYFSSSMAVMLRTLNVPTRWVKGFAPGTRNIQSSEWITGREALTLESSEGTYRVTNADAHSWVEVYLGDYGWIAFEPTPGFTMIEATDNQAEEVEPEQEKPAQEEQEIKETRAADEAMELPAWLGLTAKLIVGTAVAAGFIFAFLKWYAVGFSFRWFRIWNRKLTIKERMILETELWLSYCRLKGMKKHPAETVREAAKRWSADKPELATSAAIIVECFEQAKYGREAVTSDNWQRLKQAIRQFKHTR